jgi:putative flippase GtrA
LRILRFAVSGCVSTGTHVVVALLLGRLGIGSGLANGGAFCVALVVSWFLNTVWTFGQAPSRAQLVRFALVSLVGLAATMAIAEAVRALGGADLMGIAVVVLVVPVVTFLLHSRWTYAERDAGTLR